MSIGSRAAAGTCLGLSTVLVSAAQLLFRFVMQDHEALAANILTGVPALPGTIGPGGVLLLALGITLYAISMCLWIFALARFDVSFAYPLISISYILVHACAIFLPGFDESFSVSRLIGTLIIVAGVILLLKTESRVRQNA